jgi:Leucine-rich repeat (LRR) protein
MACKSCRICKVGGRFLAGQRVSLTRVSVFNASHNLIKRSIHVAPLRGAGFLFGPPMCVGTPLTRLDAGLRALILNHNKLTRVEGLDKLGELGALVVSHNQIEELSLSGTPKLTKLSMSHNKLSKIPSLTVNRRFSFIKKKTATFSLTRLARGPFRRAFSSKNCV